MNSIFVNMQICQFTSSVCAFIFFNQLKKKKSQNHNDQLLYLFISQMICAFYSDCVKVAALRLLTPPGPFIFSPTRPFLLFPMND